MKQTFYLYFILIVLFCSCSAVKVSKTSSMDQHELGMLISNEENKGLRKIAIRKLTDQHELGMVVSNEENTRLRKIAIRKLTDQHELGMVVQMRKTQG